MKDKRLKFFVQSRFAVTAFAAAGLALALWPVGAQSQDSTSMPLAEIARQQRAKPHDRHVRLFTNDDLQKVDFNNGAVRTGSSPDGTAKPDADKTPGDVKADPTAADHMKLEADYRQKFLSQTRNLGLLERELEVMQHEQQLQASIYYQDAGSRLRDPKAFTEQQTRYEDQITAKQKELDNARQALDSLKEEAHKAQVPARVFEENQDNMPTADAAPAEANPAP